MLCIYIRTFDISTKSIPYMSNSLTTFTYHLAELSPIHKQPGSHTTFVTNDVLGTKTLLIKTLLSLLLLVVNWFKGSLAIIKHHVNVYYNYYHYYQLWRPSPLEALSFGGPSLNMARKHALY